MAETASKKQKAIKFTLQLIGGGAAGFLFSYLGFNVLDLDVIGPDAVVLACIGLIYVMIGMIVGIGLIAPNSLGAKMLNVEDAGELNEQRRVLTGSSICMFAIGAGFLALVISGPNGVLPPVAGFAAMIAGLLATVIIAARDWKYYDELMRQISIEASYFAFCILCVIAWIWCAAAWVGWASAPTPLVILSAISGVYLFAAFYVTARRGMLTPR